MQSEDYEEKGDIALLDLLVVMAENIKLVVLGSLVSGLLALGVCFVLPPSYTSQAILALPPQTPGVTTQTPAQAVAMLNSTSVQDTVIEKLALAKTHSMQTARTEMTEAIKITLGKEGLLRLDVKAASPLEAQALANATIDAWLKTTVPGEHDRADLAKRLKAAQTGLAAVQGFLDRMTHDSSAAQGKPLTRGDSGISLVAIGELQARYMADLIALPRALQGLSRDVLVQAPTLPTEYSSPKKGLAAVIATLLGGFVLVMGLFVRHAWANMAQDPGTAAQLNRLRLALGRKPRPAP